LHTVVKNTFCTNGYKATETNKNLELK